MIVFFFLIPELGDKTYVPISKDFTMTICSGAYQCIFYHVVYFVLRFRYSSIHHTLHMSFTLLLIPFKSFYYGWNAQLVSNMLTDMLSNVVQPFTPLRKLNNSNVLIDIFVLFSISYWILKVNDKHFFFLFVMYIAVCSSLRTIRNPMAQKYTCVFQFQNSK